MTDLTFRDGPTVALVDHMGSDSSVTRAARVSVIGGNDVGDDDKREAGLIRYLMNHRHGSPFEHATLTWYVKAPIFVFREFQRHRIASYNEMCLAGDTVVTRLTKNSDGVQHKKNATLEVMWRNWHEGVPDALGRKRLLKSCREIYVRSYDEETLEPRKSKVVDIKKNGTKITWLVTTEAGRQVRSSMDHKYFTPEGWKRLEELRAGDYVYRSGKVRASGEPAIPRRLRQGIQIWTTHMKQFIVPTEGAPCYLCSTPLSYAEAQIDHVIPVVLDLSKALDSMNLKPVCAPCHRAKTNSEQKYADRLGSTASLRADKILSISEPREEETYDLVLEDPHHNFLANGIVVHNSGRYTTLPPEFYVPAQDRPLVNIGTSARPEFAPGSEEQVTSVQSILEDAYRAAWDDYQYLLREGIANEVARIVLPVGIMSQMYVTMNVRALMNFLSLRTDDPEAAVRSRPQYEIEQVARRMEQDFAENFPLVYAAWQANGRVAP